MRSQLGDVLPVAASDVLVAMVQAHGLAAVVDALGEIADCRAHGWGMEHATGNTPGSQAKANAWAQAGHALRMCWRKVYGDAQAPAPLPW